MRSELSTESIFEREARIKEVLAMTDEDICARIAADPDSQVPNDVAFLKRGVWTKGDSDESPEERRVRWKHLMAKTDEEIEADIASDPDSQVPIEALRNGYWLNQLEGYAEMRIRVDLPVLAWFHEHHIDPQLICQQAMRQAMQSHSN